MSTGVGIAFNSSLSRDRQYLDNATLSLERTNRPMHVRTAAVIALMATLLSGCGGSRMPIEATLPPPSAILKDRAGKAIVLLAMGFEQCPAVKRATIPVTTLVTDSNGHPLTGPFPRVYFTGKTLAPHAVIKPESFNRPGTSAKIYYDGTPNVQGYFTFASGRGAKPASRTQQFFAPGGQCLHLSPSVLLVRQNTTVSLHILGSAGPFEQDPNRSACEDWVTVTPGNKSGSIFKIRAAVDEPIYCQLGFDKKGSSDTITGTLTVIVSS